MVGYIYVPNYKCTLISLDVNRPTWPVPRFKKKKRNYQTPPSPYIATLLTSDTAGLLALELDVNEPEGRCSCCAWLLSLSVVHLRFTQVAVCGGRLSLLSAVECPVV